MIQIIETPDSGSDILNSVNQFLMKHKNKIEVVNFERIQRKDKYRYLFVVDSTEIIYTINAFHYAFPADDNDKRELVRGLAAGKTVDGVFITNINENHKYINEITHTLEHTVEFDVEVWGLSWVLALESEIPDLIKSNKIIEINVEGFDNKTYKLITT